MKSFWNDKEARHFRHDPVALRVYTSRLLGREPSLVLHGGGNTSVKVRERNLFGEDEELLYIKGSGWDLATIEKRGFSPVKLDVLKKMAAFDTLSDLNMARLQRAAMTDPNAPAPSVEAILHAIIPYKFVDHTHADKVVTITNTPHGEKYIREIYGERLIVIPYVMPGFILAKKVFELTRGLTWDKYEGMILTRHGVFTFHDDAKKSYERMIRIVTRAENFIKDKSRVKMISVKNETLDLKELAKLRRAVSEVRGKAVLARLERGAGQVSFASLNHVEQIATRGPLTPDHVIRTKPVAAIIDGDVKKSVKRFADRYLDYFKRNKTPGLTCLDPAPRWAVWKKRGIVIFGSNVKELQITSDIIDHTIQAIREAEGLGGYRALAEKDIFDVEYWSLEQAKLNKTGQAPVFEGKAALVTGAASGIGKACVLELLKQGAAVAALDINPAIQEIFRDQPVLCLLGDVTKAEDIKKSVEATVGCFGGLDILISNAGIFPATEAIAELKDKTWDRSLEINLTSHERLLKECIPYLKMGFDPAVVMIASKNVPAPGPGAGAYSVAKAGLTQLARVASLELASSGIRVNVVHPNQVFDTAIWTPEVLANRAKHYRMTVEEYKKSNLLKVKITSRDVALLACCMAGPVFSKTTGAQIPIDGGNDRVI